MKKRGVISWKFFIATFLNNFFYAHHGVHAHRKECLFVTSISDR